MAKHGSPGGNRRCKAEYRSDRPGLYDFPSAPKDGVPVVMSGGLSNGEGYLPGLMMAYAMSVWRLMIIVQHCSAQQATVGR
jgi:hypothetical protein